MLAPRPGGAVGGTGPGDSSLASCCHHNHQSDREFAAFAMPPAAAAMRVLRARRLRARHTAPYAPDDFPAAGPRRATRRRLICCCPSAPDGSVLEFCRPLGLGQLYVFLFVDLLGLSSCTYYVYIYTWIWAPSRLALSRRACSPQKTYPSSTRFFPTYLPVFKIRANNNSSWIQLKP